MRHSVFTLTPCDSYPFYVQAIQYVPKESFDNGLTLIFLHAMNLHKETFEPMLRYLVKQPPEIRIRDVWCIENPNQGESAGLNEKILSTPQYRKHWTAAEYARAVQFFLSSSLHGVDFSRRTVVGIAHSGSAPSLLLLQDQASRISFRALVFLDPAILPSGKLSSRVMCDLFGNWAMSKRHTWNSRSTALEQLSSTAFKRWTPQGIKLFVDKALRLCADGSSVTLACSPMQEAAFYMSPQADLIERPFEIFTQLTAADELPIHLIVCLNDEYRGKTAEMKGTQIALIEPMAKGSVQIVEGGHMFPQTEPQLCAEAIIRVLQSLQMGVARL
ncbi:Alpha/beta hydrolase fold-1 [Favolaschia claudopus]|uniref:Alpha/beta hydrolase fold-1 n=1 Tax=Favolaschia claudopus TaxID=2862362 RepID=A0AAW0C5R0_9AGAR